MTAHLFLFCCPSALRQNKCWFNPADTSALVGAVAFGKGLSKCRPPGGSAAAAGHAGPPGALMPGGGPPTLQQVTMGAGGQQGPPQQQGQPGRTSLPLCGNISSCVFIYFFFSKNVPSAFRQDARHQNQHQVGVGLHASLQQMRPRPPPSVTDALARAPLNEGGKRSRLVVVVQQPPYDVT